MAKARTIDNLGVDISTRWAQDQALLDKELIKGAPVVSTQTEIDVTLPSFFGIRTSIRGAAPHHYMGRLFRSSQIRGSEKAPLYLSDRPFARYGRADRGPDKAHPSSGPSKGKR